MPDDLVIIGRPHREVNARGASRRIGASIALVALVAIVLLASCNDPERRANGLYAEADELMDRGEMRAAAEVLERIVDEYPTTDAARRARQEVTLFRGLFEAETLYPVRRARDVMVQTARAIQRYRDRHRRYPATLDELRPGLLAEPPLDPWGRALVYEPAAGGRSYRLSCLGGDGREGGTGEATDWIVENGRFVSALDGV